MVEMENILSFRSPSGLLWKEQDRKIVISESIFVFVAGAWTRDKKMATESSSLVFQSDNPLIRGIGRVLSRVSSFKELARAYYFEVITISLSMLGL
jgi:hypothetical protein